jgi:uncharacterized protein (TIGR00251 family)
LTAAGAGISLRRSSDGVSFWIHASPRAARERVGGLHGDALRVAVREPPVEGAANAACARALARALGLDRRTIAIDPAAKGRRKRVQVRIPQHAVDALEAALRSLAGAER